MKRRRNISRISVLLMIIFALFALTGARGDKGKKSEKPKAQLKLPDSTKEAGVKCDQLFSKVVVSGHVDVQINLNQGYGCLVEPPELAKKLDIKIKDETVFVEPASEWGTWFQTEQVKVTITTMDVDEIKVRGSGDVVLSDKIGGNLTAILRGSGDLLVQKGKVDELKVAVNGDGSFAGELLEIKRANVRTMGSGDFSLGKVSDSLRLELSGSGNGEVKRVITSKAVALLKGSAKLTLAGVTGSLKTRIFGSAKLNAKALTVKIADVLIKGSGQAEVRVTDTLKADIFGSGILTYFGEPMKIEKNVNGSGWVEQAK